MKRYHLLTLLIILILFVFAAAQESEKMKIAVLDFSNTGGVSLHESSTLTNRLRSMIVNTKAVIVLERGKMEEILSEQGFQQTGCTSTECAVEVGKMLNVQKMVSGSIGKLGNTYTIDLSLIDVKTAQIERSFTRDYRGEIDGLLKVMESVATQISSTASTSQASETSSGNMYVMSSPQGAEVYLDQVYMGETPISLTNIRTGIHNLKLKEEGYDDEEKEIEIIENKVSNLTINLKKVYILSINSNPEDAEIIINNKKIGMTPFSGKAKEGMELNIIVKKENYDPWVKNIVVRDNINMYAELIEGVTLKAKKGGGGGKWLLLGAAIIGGGAAYYFIQEKDKDDEGDQYNFPAPPTRPNQ